MNWKDAKKYIDFQLDMNREGALAKLELCKRLQDFVNNERSTQEILLEQTERAEAELSVLNDEKSFRDYCDARAEWHELYMVGASEKQLTEPEETVKVEA